MKIYLATWLLEDSQGESLSKVPAFSRLISYYHTKDKPKEEVLKYIKTGKAK